MRYYTVIVIKIDTFESQIIDERHFSSYDAAEAFSKTISQNVTCVIAELKSPLI